MERYDALGSAMLAEHPDHLPLLLEALAGCGEFSQQQQFLAELEALVASFDGGASVLGGDRGAPRPDFSRRDGRTPHRGERRRADRGLGLDRCAEGRLEP